MAFIKQHLLSLFVMLVACTEQQLVSQLPVFMVHGCMVYTESAEVAPGTYGNSHVTIK